MSHETIVALACTLLACACSRHEEAKEQTPYPSGFEPLLDTTPFAGDVRR
jgi:hypothetical protein